MGRRFDNGLGDSMRSPTTGKRKRLFGPKDELSIGLELFLKILGLLVTPIALGIICKLLTGSIETGFTSSKERL